MRSPIVRKHPVVPQQVIVNVRGVSLVIIYKVILVSPVRRVVVVYNMKLLPVLLPVIVNVPHVPIRVRLVVL